MTTQLVGTGSNLQIVAAPNSYRTTINGQLLTCQASTKSEARGIFRQMTAKRLYPNGQGGWVMAVKSRLRSKVRLTKEQE